MVVGNRNLLLSFLFFLQLYAFAQQQITLPDVVILGDSIKSAPQYSGTTAQPVQLLHMELEIFPRWENHSVEGKAHVYAKPTFNPIDTLELNAQKFDLHKVAVVVGGSKENAAYTYNQQILKIALPKTYTKEDVVHVYIDYTANPDSIKNSGGTAVTDDKGFYFIDDTEEFEKHFWTQGETESNSAWFPTIDKPNQRFTHKIGITLDTAWKSLSNGELEFRTLNNDGTKTDYWVMDQPHAPYLVMVAGGNFDTIGSRWKNIPLHYYVEPKWAHMAPEFFKHTPEMLTFFSTTLGVDYPWQKYDQIVVRDYVSGAMENTTASVFAESMYKNYRSLADGTKESTIAHEIMHQWFGDYVTCKTWGDATLNEGFASFAEYMWEAYKYGTDEGELFLQTELKGYLRTYRNKGPLPLIRNEYESPDHMFDGYSYNKGGLTLYMLKTIVGDDAFYASLKKYLTTNAYSAVEIYDLRKAFEETTGQDLRWFFNQWFLQPGHPNLKVKTGFDRDKGVATLRVEQVQNTNEQPIFTLPVAVDVYTQLGVKRHFITITKQKQNFEFPVLSQPYLTKFDAQNYLIAEVEIEQTDANWLSQLGKSKSAVDRGLAIDYLIKNSNKNLLSTVAGIAMDDKFWNNQIKGLQTAELWDDVGKKKLKSTVKGLLNSTNNRVRAKAISVWANVYKEKDTKLYKENLDFISTQVNKAAFDALAFSDAKSALKIAQDSLQSENTAWLNMSASVIAQEGSIAEIEAAAELIKTKSVSLRFRFYIDLVNSLDRSVDVGKKCADILTIAAIEDENNGIRYYIPKLMAEKQAIMDEELKIITPAQAKINKEMIDYIKQKITQLESKK